MDARDTIVVAGATQGKGSHVEIGLALFDAQSQELLVGNAVPVAPFGEIVADHFLREMIVPGRNRCVRREHDVGGDRLDRRRE